jgi:DNA methylase
MLIFGENLQVLRQFINLKAQGALRNADGSDGVRVCYIDPPFASQQEFSGNRNERAYLDNVAGAEFVEHLRRRLILIRELLTEDGSLFVHLDTRKSHYIKVILDEIFGEGNFRNEIIWKRTSAHSGAKRFAPIHDVLLFYTKSPNYKWKQSYDPLPQETIDQWYNNVEPVTGKRFNRQVLTGPGIRTGQSGQPWRGIDPGAKGRHWAMPGFVGDLLTGLSTHDALDKLDATGRMHWPAKSGGVPMLKWYLDEAKGVPALDIITELPRLSSTASERVGYPTQKPVELVQRLIAATSDGGDIMLDAFLGSGTAAVAAQTLDEPRRWIGIDSGKFAIYVTQARLLKLAGKTSQYEPFTLYNAGLYNYKALRDLPRDQYVDFVLQLFQCRKVTQNLGGVDFQGYIGDSPVLVYDFKKHPDAQIGSQFVEDLASVCRGRLGQRCFIIAPSAAVEPYEDYLIVGETKFFFLRIPYSIIAELHKRAFSDLRQPSSEARTNAQIDSVGFDFIQPPHVECRWVATNSAVEIEVLAFESEAFAAAESQENIGDLAMILVDYTYDDEIFNLSAVHFAEDLVREGWRFRLPIAQIGDRVMLIYVDLYGNEHREVLTAASFGVTPPRTAEHGTGPRAKSVKRRASERDSMKASEKKGGTGRADRQPDAAGAPREADRWANAAEEGAVE